MAALLNANFQDFCERLVAITEECRPDMHEPDNQGVTGRVIGDHLDNAMGERVSENSVLLGYQELIVILDRTRQHKGSESFNLASLIALARVGARQLLRIN